MAAAYEFGLSRQMFGYGLAYRRNFDAWSFDEVTNAPLLAHNRLEWAVDRLFPMLDRQSALTLSEQLRSTRTGLDRARAITELRSLFSEFLHATQGILADYWTLKPWQDLGEAVGAVYQELLVASNGTATGHLGTGACLASALKKLPVEAMEQSTRLASIVQAAADNDFEENFVELLLVLKQPTFWAKWSETYRNVLLPVQISAPTDTKRYRLEALSRPSVVMDADIAWTQHQAFVREQAADTQNRLLYGLWTIDNLEQALFAIVQELTDAPVLAFDDQLTKVVSYNGSIREATDNFQSWLRLLYGLRGNAISQAEAERQGKVGTNPLRSERRASTNDSLLRKLIVTTKAPVGGSRLLPLEPVM